MNTFNYKGIVVTVLNNGEKEPVAFMDRDPFDSVREISGSRIEFLHGAIKLIYELQGLLIDNSREANRIKARLIAINPMIDGGSEVIKKDDVGFSVPKEQLDAIASLPSLAGASMLKTIFMHCLNGLLSRIPELGGNQDGRGLEFYNNDGTTSQPLFTYNKHEVDTVEIIPVVPAANFNLLVDGLAVEALLASKLPSGLHQFEYRELDAAGAVVAKQVRTILV
jgi:hypothetical protein